MKRIKYNPASHLQHQAITNLLCHCFGAQYRDYYLLQLEHLPSPKHTKMIGESETDIAAFVQVVDYLYRPYSGATPLPAAYLYSVCTRQDAQGQGLMKRMLQELYAELRDEGYVLTFLVPAEIWLIDYYKDLGFKWQSSEIYAKAPQGFAPLLYPGPEAKAYLKAIDKIEGRRMSQAHYEKLRHEEWQPLTPPQLGWMSVALSPVLTDAPTPYLLQPLT